MNLPNDVNFILNKFYENNFEAFIVGGCVRDSLLKKTPHDYDITTNALPNETQSLFEKTIPTGIKHGTITVLINDNPFEVTTYRIDGKYLDNRKPENVEFVTNIKEDLARRDFTINALAYSPKFGFKDFFNGKEDLKNKVIRCVGIPDKRFNEDALRILRAIRFSCQLNFEIEDSTFDSIKRNFHLVKNISKERIRDEFSKILLSSWGNHGLALLNDIGLLGLLMPSLKENFNLDNKTLKNNYNFLTLVSDKLSIKLSSFFFIFSNFKENKLIFEKILKDLHYDNKTIKETLTFINEFNTPLILNRYELKKFINKVSKELVFDLINFKKSFLKLTNNNLDTINLIEKEVKDIINSKEPLSIRDLAINGNTLVKELNLKPGKEIGLILNNILDEVLKNPNLNVCNSLIDIANDKYLNLD
ncbi:MAG: CCA tRNA nucleotidyltransferase [Clostridium perfringens]|nr:CCA tRNA nucleotidyltransferase [Clostridium perfringens]